jgi:hypothetical protein
MALRDLARKHLHAPAVASIAIVAAAVSASATAGAPLLTLKENRGAAVLVDAIEAGMPDALVVASLRAANLGAALASTRHRSVVVVDLDRPLHRAAVTRWIGARSEEGKSAWLLVEDEILPAGARTSIAGRWTYRREFVERTERPPLREVRAEKVSTSLIRVDGLDSGFAFEGFGGTPSWGIPDEGFLRSETTPFGTLRMTNGSALLDVPSAMLAKATALEFTWFSWAPHGESRNVGIRIDGVLAWRARVAPGVSTISVPLLGPKVATTRVEIDSDAFDPRDLDPADYRDRVGIGVVRIRAMRP